MRSKSFLDFICKLTSNVNDLFHQTRLRPRVSCRRLPIISRKIFESFRRKEHATFRRSQFEIFFVVNFTLRILSELMNTSV